jgi:hypothetical protein
VPHGIVCQILWNYLQKTVLLHLPVNSLINALIVQVGSHTSGARQMSGYATNRE